MGNLEGVSVKAKKESYEKIQEKYRIQRSMKDNNRGKLNRGKKSKPPSPEKTEDPMAKILQELKGIKTDLKDLNEIETDLKSNTLKIDQLQGKICELESESKLKEVANSKKFEDIRTEISTIESTVTGKIVAEIQPTIMNLKNDLQSNLQAEMVNMKGEIQPSIDNLKKELHSNMMTEMNSMKEDLKE